MQIMAEQGKRFFGSFVAVNTINRNLKILQPALVQFIDDLWCEQKTIGDHCRSKKFEFAPAKANQLKNIGMRQGLAACERDRVRTERFELFGARDQCLQRQGM
jgi:hypothetical protein